MDLLRFFHPVATSRQVDAPVLGRGSVVSGRVGTTALAVFRDGEGVARALLDRCAHRFAPLSQGHVRADGRLACPYHGWHFDGHGQGKSPHLPTLSGCDVPSFATHEQDGLVFVGHASAPPPPPSPTHDPALSMAGTFSMLFPAPLHVVLDNFSEDEHTPYVHTYLGWLERDAETVRFEAENLADRVRVYYEARQRPAPLARLVGVRRGDLFVNRWETRFDPVRISYDVSWRAGDTGEPRPLSLFVPTYFVPWGSDKTKVFASVYVRATQRLPELARAALGKLALGLVWNEYRQDQRFVDLLKDTPFSLKGMRLGRFDKPVIHNRKLLSRIYFGDEGTQVEAS